MAGGPRPVTGRRAQQVLREYDRYLGLADLFADPARWIGRAKDRWAGASHYPVCGDEFWMQTTARGIELVPHPGRSTDPPTEVLRWAEVTEIADAVEPGVREALIQAQHEANRHQRSYPRFIARGIAVGCGRPPAVGPLTEAQTSYQQQAAEWEASDAEGRWRREQADLRAVVGELLDRALPLLADTEPVDLLELLDQTTAGDGPPGLSTAKAAIHPASAMRKQAVPSGSARGDSSGYVERSRPADPPTM